MIAKLLGLAASAMVSACVSTPEGYASVYGTEGHGQPLAESEVVALYLSTSLVPVGSKQETGSAWLDGAGSIHPVRNKDAEYKALADGFLHVRPDVQVVIVEEPLRQACFDKGDKLVMSDGAILVRPDVSSPRCRALIGERRIRYFVSFAGWSETASTTVTEAVGVGVAVSSERGHQFKFVARAFDAMHGAQVCEERAMASARSRQGGGFTVLPAPPMVLPLPLIWVTTIDEPAFFAHTAWLAGAKAGMCFVEAAKTTASPSSVLGDVLAVPTNQRWCLFDSDAKSVTCEIGTYEECLLRKPDGRHRCVLSD